MPASFQLVTHVAERPIGLKETLSDEFIDPALRPDLFSADRPPACLG